jgi:hypothetical protein
MYYFLITEAGIAQLVQRMTTGCRTEGSEFESRYGEDFYSLHFVQACSSAHKTSYTMGTGGPFSEGKAAVV